MSLFQKRNRNSSSRLVSYQQSRGSVLSARLVPYQSRDSVLSTSQDQTALSRPSPPKNHTEYHVKTIKDYLDLDSSKTFSTIVVHGYVLRYMLNNNLILGLTKQCNRLDLDTGAPEHLDLATILLVYGYEPHLNPGWLVMTKFTSDHNHKLLF